MISVKEAAEILGLDARQVRRLASRGRIVGRRSSAGWLLDEGSVRQLARSRPSAGRPLSPKRAWMLLRALDEVPSAAAKIGNHPDPDRVIRAVLENVPIDPSERPRLRLRLRRLPDDDQALENLLRLRAEWERYQVHPGVLEELADDESVAIGGARALARVAGLSEGSEPLTFYVNASQKQDLVARYRAKPDPSGNVQFAVIPASVPNEFRPPLGQITSASVTYIDAIATADARARACASDWLQHVRAPLVAD